MFMLLHPPYERSKATPMSDNVGYCENARMPVSEVKRSVLGYEVLNNVAGGIVLRAACVMLEDITRREYARSGMAAKELNGREGRGNRSI